MITVRKLRDAAFAVLLALPTLALTRPTATEALSPAASQSDIAANAAKTEMTVDERRTAIPAEHAR